MKEVSAPPLFSLGHSGSGHVNLPNAGESLTILGIRLNDRRPNEYPSYPAVVLAQIKNMKDGQVAVLATGPENISVLHVQASQAQPLTLEQAWGAIGQVLLSDKRKTPMETEIKKLRSSKIDYASGFSPAVPSAQAGESSGQAARP